MVFSGIFLVADDIAHLDAACIEAYFLGFIIYVRISEMQG